MARIWSPVTMPALNAALSQMTVPTLPSLPTLKPPEYVKLADLLSFSPLFHHLVGSAV